MDPQQVPRLPFTCCVLCSNDQRCPKRVLGTAYKHPHPASPSPHLEITMNFKSLAALTLAASAAPLVVAGPFAYGLCQTGAFPPTIIRLCTHYITRLQYACSCVLRCCRIHFWSDHCWGAPCHHGVQRGPGNLHGSVRCYSTPCPNPLSVLRVNILRDPAASNSQSPSTFIEAFSEDVISSSS